jgi:superfamily II DNA or RNA helicase
MKLRPYQEDAVSAVLGAPGWAGPLRRPALIAPTGSGKTVIFTEIIKRVVAAGQGKVVVLVHRDFLAEQTIKTLRALAPEVQSGVVQGKNNEVDAEVIVASVQTLVRENRMSQVSGVRRIIVDECHHASAQSYRTILQSLGAMDDGDPDVKTLGVTATLDRSDNGKLGDVWQDVIWEKDILWMIRHGYLCDVKGLRIKVPDLDLTKVRRIGGDLSESGVGEALTQSLAPEIVAKAYLEHADNMPGAIFAPTKDSAEVFAEAFNLAGIETRVIHDGVSKKDQKQIRKDFDDGKFQVLSNCMILTEGFDSPRMQCAVVARCTESAPLYIQIVGRALRLHPDKTHALVMDVSGVTEKHSLMTLKRLVKTETELQDRDVIESLIDLHDEPTTSLRDVEEVYYGPVESKLVDLFDGSRQQWLRTDGGYWFIQVGERYIALAPVRNVETDDYDVMWFSKLASPRAAGGGWIRQNVPGVELAMSIAEDDVSSDEKVLSDKKSRWRKRAATVKQVELLRNLGIDVEENIKSGEAQKLISQRFGSRRIDPAMSWYYSQLEAMTS